jgi:tetratricopeptide (TPR) repeat protein
MTAMLLAASTAWGAGGGPNTVRDEPSDPVVEAVQGAVAKSDWGRARDLARAGVEKNPANADYQNLLAYALRMGPNPPMDLVFRHYNEALRLDPRHRGAHEYLGEAYLMAGNLAKAKEHLRVLDDLCFLPCREYSMLKQAVADYEAKQPRPAAAN